MYCCENISHQPQKKFPIKFSFKREELLYDIKNASFVEGDIMDTDNIHAQHQVFDVGESGNVDRVTRVLNLAHSECVEMLFPYTKLEIPTEQETIDNTLNAPEEYVIDAVFPEGFSMTTVNLLRELIHEYLVCTALADWMSITNPKSQKNWEEKKERIKSKVRTSLVSRRGKVRRKISPF